MSAINSIDFQLANQASIAAARRKMNSSYTNKTGSKDDSSVFDKQINESGYACTDESDDGQISTWEKVKCVGNGIFNSITGMITGAFKNPLKTAAMVGLCCIPVVGPIAMGYFAAQGLISGIKQIAQAAEISDNATSDAEAKYAWENIGSGGFQAGTSLLGLKGAGSLFKSQIASSSTVAAIKSGASVGEIAKTAISETAKNAGAIIETVKNKTIKAGNGVKNIYKGIKDNGFSNYVNGKFTQFKKWGKTKTENFGNNLQEKIDNFGKDQNGTSLADRIKNKFSKSAKTKRQANADAAAKQLEELKANPNAQKTSSGYEVKETGAGGKEITRVYDSKGYLKETTRKTTQNGVTTTETVSYSRNNAITSKKTTQAPAEGTTGTTIETVDTYGKLGSHKTTTTSTTKNADGTTTKTVDSTKQTTFGNTVKSKTTDSISADGQTTNTYKFKTNERTGVTYKKSTSGNTTTTVRSNAKTPYEVETTTQTVDGKATSNTTYKVNGQEATTTPGRLDKLKTFANTNNLGAYANRFVGKANPFESNWLYGTYSWYEATREE